MIWAKIKNGHIYRNSSELILPFAGHHFLGCLCRAFFYLDLARILWIKVNNTIVRVWVAVDSVQLY